MSFSLGLPPHTCTCTRAGWCTRILYLPLFSLNKARLSLPMRETAERLSCWLRRSLFWGDCVSVHVQRLSAASLFGGCCLWRCFWHTVYLCERCTVIGPVMYLSCGLSGASTAPPLCFLNESGRRNLKQLPASFFSFFFFFSFFKPRRNVSHERDWLKWLQSNPRKVRFHNFTKAMLQEEIHWIQNVFTINHRKTECYTPLN